MSYKPEDILFEREERVRIQNYLMNRYKKPLLFIRVNYPGVNKENKLTNNIIKIMDNTVTNIFEKDIIFKFSRITAEGPNVIVVIDKEVYDIKKLTIQIEDKHILGRCVDIDVYDPKDGSSISRKDLGFSSRKCYICDDIAQNCVRSRKHETWQIINYIDSCYERYKEIFDV